MGPECAVEVSRKFVGGMVNEHLKVLTFVLGYIDGQARTI